MDLVLINIDIAADNIGVDAAVGVCFHIVGRVGFVDKSVLVLAAKWIQIWLLACWFLYCVAVTLDTTFGDSLSNGIKNILLRTVIKYLCVCVCVYVCVCGGGYCQEKLKETVLIQPCQR